jgi:hypothetical protein
LAAAAARDGTPLTLARGEPKLEERRSSRRHIVWSRRATVVIGAITVESFVTATDCVGLARAPPAGRSCTGDLLDSTP